MCSSTAVTASGWRPRILCFRRGPRCVSPGCGGAGSSRRVGKALRGRAAEPCHSPLEIPESISWVLCEVRVERQLRPGDRKTHTEILEIAASCRLGIVRGDARLEVAGLQRVATDLVEPALAFMRHLPVALLVDRVANRKLIHGFSYGAVVLRLGERRGAAALSCASSQHVDVLYGRGLIAELVLRLGVNQHCLGVAEVGEVRVAGTTPAQIRRPLLVQVRPLEDDAADRGAGAASAETIRHLLAIVAASDGLGIRDATLGIELERVG